MPVKCLKCNEILGEYIPVKCQICGNTDITQYKRVERRMRIRRLILPNQIYYLLGTSTKVQVRMPGRIKSQCRVLEASDQSKYYKFVGRLRMISNRVLYKRHETKVGLAKKMRIYKNGTIIEKSEEEK